MEERILQRIDQKLTLIVGLLYRLQRDNVAGASAITEVLELHRGGLTPEEIARALGRSPDAVYKALQRGAVKLRISGRGTPKKR